MFITIGNFDESILTTITGLDMISTVKCPNFGRSGHSKSSCANYVVCSSPIYLS